MSRNRKQKSVRDLTVCALFSAMLCVTSPISIPVGPIPITLGLFSVLLVAVSLPSSKSLASVAVFLVLGFCGLPVFAGGNGGALTLIGPTGGYVWSYLPVTLLVGLLSHGSSGSFRRCFLACLLGLAVCYACGMLQFLLQTQISVGEALLMTVFPFLPFDLVKIVLAVHTATRLRSFFKTRDLFSK